MLQKKSFKVIAPILHRDGSHHWARVGNGFTNKDGSINMYLTQIPVATKNGEVQLQLRELTEEELRERTERRAAFASHSSPVGVNPIPTLPAGAADSIPF